MRRSFCVCRRFPPQLQKKKGEKGIEEGEEGSVKTFRKVSS